MTFICIRHPSLFSPYYIDRRPPSRQESGAPPIRRECGAHSSAGDPANATTPRRAAVARACVQTDQLSRAVPNAASGAWEGRNIQQQDSNSIINSTAPPPSRNGRGGSARACWSEISFPLRKPSVRAFDSRAQGFRTPLARRRWSCLAEYGAYSPDKTCHDTLARAAAPYQTFSDSATCFSRTTSSRRTPNWLPGRGALGGHHPQPTKPPPHLNRPAESRSKSVRIISYLEGGSGPTPAGKTLPHTYTKKTVSEGERTKTESDDHHPEAEAGIEAHDIILFVSDLAPRRANNQSINRSIDHQVNAQPSRSVRQ